MEYLTSGSPLALLCTFCYLIAYNIGVFISNFI
jgi:hypothetical protein